MIPVRLRIAWMAMLMALPSGGQTLTDLSANFRQPPNSARPQTLWFWMNGNVTRDGITRDLEALKHVGIQGVLMFDGASVVPKGPVDYMSPQWRGMLLHAVQEAHRLGLTVGMHNAPGWSSTGGPWITPELSMQELVWTEATVTGPGKARLALPQPQTNEGYYRDAMVLAFPSGKRDEERRRDVHIGPHNALTLEFGEPFEARAITLIPESGGHFPSVRLEASDDGAAFRPVCRVANPGRRGIQPPGSENFAPVRARFFRLTASTQADFREVVLHRTPLIQDWVYKANFAYRVGGQVELPKDAENGFAIDPATVRDLSRQMDEHGELTWDVPAGTWTILRLGQTSTGQRNISASQAGTGLECDKMNRAAVDFHFQNVQAKLLADFGPLAPGTFNGIEIDSYEAGMQNWTAAFPTLFAKHNGYDLRAWMPALTGRIVGDARLSERFLYDVRRTQADLMASEYYGRFAELCHEHGLKFYVEPYGQGVFDESQVGGIPDYPMTEFWTRTPWTPNRVTKSVSSAAHTYGHQVVAGESFTGEEETSRWLDYPYSMKVLGDEMFALGLNQMLFHRDVQQPHPTAAPGMTMGPWGFNFDRTNTWFGESRPWLDYLARCQYLLRQGNYAADVLYFIGERPPDVAEFAMPVLPAGYNYDLVNAEVLLTRASVENGRIVLRGGSNYRVLMLPDDLRGMTPELIRKLRDMVSAGATIMGPKPEFSLTLRGYPGSETEFQRIANGLWPGRVVSGQSIEHVLRDKGIAPDFEYTSREPDGALSWTHRVLPDADIYFVANRQRRQEDVVCRFRVSGKRPELWHPETGEIEGAAIYTVESGGVRVPLHLGPAESVFVVFRKAAETEPAQWLAKDGTKIIRTQPFSTEPGVTGKFENTFTISVWIKPDTDLRLMPRESTEGRVDETGKNYVVPAPEGDMIYGKGHASAGVAAGRNGVYVIERSSIKSPAVLVAPVPISGWAHLVVVYRAGRPSLYLNGKFVREGLVSGAIVHPGVGAPPPSPGTVFHFAGLDSLVHSSGRPSPPSQGMAFYFEGNMTKPEVWDRAIDVPAGELPPPQEGPDIDVAQGAGQFEALIWRSGTYALSNGGSIRADVQPSQGVEGPWQVDFQAGRGAPPSITLPALISLEKHADPGVRYFSGTATYKREVRLEGHIGEGGQRVYLDLGRVEVLANVRVNGRDMATLWKEPYRVDITGAVHPGSNSLEVRVTNLWPNRLIGDQQLPPENEYRQSAITRLPEWYVKGEPKPPGGRVSFLTWQFFGKDDPLPASGLLGPVRILFPLVRTFRR
jgi:hypothetical protein